DALEAACGLILAAGGTLPVLVSEVGSANNKPVEAKQSQLPEKRNPKAQKLDTHILATFDDDRYITADRDKDTRKGGAKIHPLLRKISEARRPANDPAGDGIVRCIASRPRKTKASAEVRSVDLDSDSNENTAALEWPAKKARMELQVASSSKRTTPFDRMYVTERGKALKEHGNNALIMVFVTCTGVLPHVIDSAEFGVLQQPERQV
ncbi:hypothetical protein AZE42_11065, partial [Rhizopogon vesiculosus]